MSFHPSVTRSDHRVVSCHFTHQLVSFCKCNKCTVWIYSKADFTRASELITDTNWDALIGDCIDTSWTNWKLKFLDIMTKTIPRKTISVRQNIPWLNLAILKKIRKRKSLYTVRLGCLAVVVVGGDTRRFEIKS